MWLRKQYNYYFSPQKQFIQQISKILGFIPNDIDNFKLAFQHKSRHKRANNERLEFLGDAIIDSVITHELYLKYRKKSEGDLSKLRSKAVSRVQLNNIGEALGLVDMLDYKTPSNFNAPGNLAGNTLEALVGAVYLDVGYSRCYKFIKEKMLSPHIHWGKLDREIIDFKSLLFNYAQKNDQAVVFEVIEDATKPNIDYFEISLLLDNEPVSKGKGSSKKSAEQEAAKKALKQLKLIK